MVGTTGVGMQDLDGVGIDGTTGVGTDGIIGDGVGMLAFTILFGAQAFMVVGHTTHGVTTDIVLSTEIMVTTGIIVIMAIDIMEEELHIAQPEEVAITQVIQQV